MRTKKRKIRDDAFQHTYQNTCRGILLFYDDLDRLLFYTTFAIAAKRYRAQVIAFTLMYNHTHALFRLDNPLKMGDFVRDYTSYYAMEFNRDSGRSGPLFQCAYGNAPKEGAKKIRTCVNYIDNNAVEKSLVERAEDYRWNLMAYLDNPSPFSEPIQRSRASRALRRSLKRVEAYSKTGAYLTYHLLREFFDGLSEKESRQLIDFIISTYLPIDKEELMLLYGDYQTMLTAVNANTGSEYDIKEDFDHHPHTIYRDLLQVCRQSSFGQNPKMLLALPPDRKLVIADILQQRTGATYYQLRKLLDLP